MHDPERDISDIPLSQLELSPANVRKTPADASAFTELKASIAAHGLLENLIARSMGPGPDGAGRYAVIAGGRRLAAMQALAAEGALDEDHPVPCRMIGGIVAAEEVSLAENSVRAAMHPADQVEAFRRLADAGSTAAAIAARFGVPTVAPPDPTGEPSTAYLQKNPVLINWYPKIQAMKSGGVVGGDAQATPNEAHLTSRHVAFLDLDRLYFNLERFKAERGWYNLNLSRQGIEALLGDSSWYCLQIPAEELVGNSYEKVRLWEEIAVALLKKYTERYYTFRKREWELPHMEYRDLEGGDPNFLGTQESPDEGYHRVLIDKSQEDIVAKLEELKTTIQKGELKPWAFQGMKAISFANHLYQPLLCLDTKVVEISPAPLNKGERQFVEDLQAFHDGHADFFDTRELYLLRNLSKGRGVGFFEAGNFHPDFILWLIEGGQQQVIFVDPKGIRNLGPKDPKILFCETIKEIEQRLGDPTVNLQSFIVSNTPSATMHRQWGMQKSEMQRRHVLFQDEDKDSYVGAMLNSLILESHPAISEGDVPGSVEKLK